MGVNNSTKNKENVSNAQNGRPLVERLASREGALLRLSAGLGVWGGLWKFGGGFVGLGGWGLGFGGRGGVWGVWGLGGVLGVWGGVGGFFGGFGGFGGVWGRLGVLGGFGGALWVGLQGPELRV